MEYPLLCTDCVALLSIDGRERDESHAVATAGRQVLIEGRVPSEPSYQSISLTHRSSERSMNHPHARAAQCPSLFLQGLPRETASLLGPVLPHARRPTQSVCLGRQPACPPRETSCLTHAAPLTCRDLARSRLGSPSLGRACLPPQEKDKEKPAPEQEKPQPLSPSPASGVAAAQDMSVCPPLPTPQPSPNPLCPSPPTFCWLPPLPAPPPSALWHDTAKRRSEWSTLPPLLPAAVRVVLPRVVLPR